MGKHWGDPITISVEPTTACNLRCPECPSGLRAFSRITGNLKIDYFKSIIDQTHRRLIYLILYFQGEPYLNPRFFEMIAYAQQKKLYTITSTNGHFLDSDNARKTVESGLDRLLISIDGATQETYESYRKGGTLSTVLEGTRNLVFWKRKLGATKPYIVFQFLVVKPNEHEITAVQNLAKELGVDELKLKTAQVYDYKNGNPLIPENTQYARYVPDGQGGYQLKYKLTDHCWKMWHSAVITWDGQVVPCCFDKDASHSMGHLDQKPFNEIWHDSPYREFRTQILRGRDTIDICNNCTEGCKVWTTKAV